MTAAVAPTPRPSETKPAPPPQVARTLTTRQRLEQLHSQLVLERGSFISHWQAINRVLFPRRGRFFITDANKGDRRNKDIIDSTATYAARTAASGMMSSITSAAREWFRLTTSNADIADQPDVKQWLHQTTQDMFAILAKSNFYDVIHMVYGDLVVYGTAPFLVDEDDEDVIRCYPFPVGSYCLANDAKLRVRTFTREWQMTVRQLVEKFGYLSCSTAVQNAWNAGNTEQWVGVVHVITDNAGYNATAIDAKYKPFTSCYFERGTNEAKNLGLLRESGYDEFPVFAARWDCTAEDVYATDCPGMTALGDINQLQFSEKRALEGIDKQVRPPLVAPNALKSAPISQLPGGVTFDDADAKSGVRTLFDAKPDLAGLEAKQTQVRERIERAFFADLFLMLSYMDESAGRQPKTAFEISERKEEKLLALGPVLNRMDKGVFGPFIDRLFQIMKRNGQLRPAPEALQGQDLRVEYISGLHAAQKAGGLGQIERFSGFVTDYFDKTQDASALDNIDVDEMVETYHDMSGVPPKLIRAPEAVAALRASRAQQKAAQAQAEQLKLAGSGAKSLSEADTTGKNGLTDVLAGVNAGQ